MCCLRSRNITRRGRFNRASGRLHSQCCPVLTAVWPVLQHQQQRRKGFRNRREASRQACTTRSPCRRIWSKTPSQRTWQSIRPRAAGTGPARRLALRFRHRKGATEENSLQRPLQVSQKSAPTKRAVLATPGNFGGADRRACAPGQVAVLISDRY